MKTQQYPCICAVIRKTGRILTRQYDHSLRPSGLKITQFSMMANIARNPDITVSELAKLLFMDQTTVTRNLRVLEKLGYICIELELADLRVKRIKLSTIGESKMNEARPMWENAQFEIKQLLGTEGIEALLNSIEKIVE